MRVAVINYCYHNRIECPIRPVVTCWNVTECLFQNTFLCDLLRTFLFLNSTRNSTTHLCLTSENKRYFYMVILLELGNKKISMNTP